MEKLTLGRLLDKVHIEGLYIVVFSNENFIMTSKARHSYAMSHAFDEKTVRDFYLNPNLGCFFIFLDDYVVDVRGMG